MSERALTDAIARKVVDGSSRIASANDQPPLERVVGMLTAYIPTSLVALFVPLWAAIANGLTANPPRLAMDDGFKFAFAIGAGLIVALYVWGVGYSKSVAKAKKAKKPAPGRLETLRKAWLEVTAAAVAMFVWATMMPASWLNLTDPAQTLGLGTVTAVLLAILAMFAGGEDRDDEAFHEGVIVEDGSS